MRNPFRYFNSSPEVIRLAVMMYIRYPLSLRQVEDLLFERMYIMSRLRCAIYTRKSTEEGLDQAFNSLDAQREACEAYIASQAGEGWRLVKTSYDDGGYCQSKLA